MIKVGLVDDDILIRESLKIILNNDSDISVVFCGENGQEAVDYCKNNEVHVFLLDMRMPVMNGVEALKIIKNISSSKVLVLTTFDEDEFIKDALKYGASGYLLKNNTPDKIIGAIKTVMNGSSVIQEEVLEKIVDDIRENKEKPHFMEEIFTDREMDIVRLISEGYSNKEISSKLYISEGTVKNYITTILSKMDLKHRTQIAVAYLKGV